MTSGGSDSEGRTHAATNGSSASSNGTQGDDTQARIDLAPTQLENLEREVRELAGQLARSSGGVDADLVHDIGEIRSLLDGLPGRIAKAVAEALAAQHKLILRDVRSALQDFGAQLGYAELSEPKSR